MAVRWYQRVFKGLVQKRMLQLLANREFTLDFEPMQLKLDASSSQPIARRLLQAMTLEEKITLLAGFDEFCIQGVERLGLKRVWTSDATIGLRGWKTKITDFPAAIALACSFDEELLQQVGLVIGEECRALGVGVLLGPGVNIARVPVCGRNFEYFGEDPYLAGRMAASYVSGVSEHEVITTVKHFACNNSEYDRHKSNSVVDERTLRELYLPAFKAALDAGSLGVMTSYNQLNGTYTSEHPYLLGSILRGDWGFDGLVISDWNSLYSTVEALKCGVDLEMPGPRHFAAQKVLDALKQKKVNEEDIDAKVLHLLTAYEKAGLFKVPMADRRYQTGTKAHQKVALQAALEGPVLLKNDGTLPFSPNTRLCIGGSNADRIAQGGGSSMVQYLEEPETLAKRLCMKGALQLPKAWYYSRKYRKQVQDCDAVVLVVGFNHIEESEAYDKCWILDPGDLKAIKWATKLNKHTTVIVQSGGAVEMSRWQQGCAAVIACPFLGSLSAQALELLLYGQVSPSGKLAYTQAKHLMDYRSMRTYPKDFDTTSIERIQKGQGDPAVRSVMRMDYTENLMVGYRQFDTEALEPLYCFGHGLSYTTFSYHNLSVAQTSEDSWHIELEVMNTGSVAGAEVVQLYIHPLEPKVFRPTQELKGFARVLLEPKQSRRVVFELDRSALLRWDVDAWAFAADEGQYELRLGSSSRDLRLKQVITYEKRKS